MQKSGLGIGAHTRWRRLTTISLLIAASRDWPLLYKVKINVLSEVFSNIIFLGYTREKKTSRIKINWLVW